MNFTENIAKVSAFYCPPPGNLTKRQFQPGFGTIFNDIKKRKLETGVSNIQPSFFINSSYEHSNTSTEISTSQVFLQQKLSNSTNKQNEFSAEPKRQKKDFRQKFKAKPIPNSLYKPNFFIRSSEKPLTYPQEFSLSTPSPHKYRYQQEVPERFKARPMPDFSNPFTPNFCITPRKPEFFENSSKKTVSAEKREYTINTAPVYKKFNSEFSTPKNMTKNSTPSKEKNLSYGQEFAKNKNFQDFEPTVPMEIELHTSARAQEREIFEEKLRQQERLKKAVIKQEHDEKHKQESEQIRLIRKQTIFKARPMPKFQGKVLEFTQDGTSDHTNSMQMMDLE